MGRGRRGNFFVVTGKYPYQGDAGCGEGYYTAGIYQALTAAGKTPRMAGTDISKAILRSAARRACGVESCVRRASLSDDGTAVIEDSVRGTGEIAVAIPLYCAVKPEEEDGAIRIGKMQLRVSGISVARIEEIPLHDTRMESSWGRTLWCIHLGTQVCGSGRWSMTFSPIQ